MELDATGMSHTRLEEFSLSAVGPRVVNTLASHRFRAAMELQLPLRMLMPGPDELSIPVKRAIEEIVRHMTSQPEAKDTLQGIHDWWLSASNEVCNLADVEQAVKTLVQWGWLTEQTLAEQTVVYGPSQAALQQGLRYLNSPKNETN